MAGTGAVAVTVPDSTSEKTPLLQNEAGKTDADATPAGQEEPAQGGCSLFTAIPVTILGLGALFCLAGGLVTEVIPMSFVLLLAGIVGLVGSVSAGVILCSMGGMRHQFYRFRRENNRLHRTSTKMQSDVKNLAGTNSQLAIQVDSLHKSVDEMQGINDGLHDQLGQFSDLRQGMEKYAKETGDDISVALSSVNNVYGRMHDLSLQNEKALLLRIASDLEFMDQEEGFSKEEFERFILRIPKHLQDRFNASKMTYESVAGRDGIIDYKEMADLIDKLLKETDSKIKPGR